MDANDEILAELRKIRSHLGDIRLLLIVGALLIVAGAVLTFAAAAGA